MSDLDLDLDDEFDVEEKFNPRDLVVTTCQLKPRGKAPKARCGHSFSVLGNKVFMYGGADHDKIFGESYIYDIGKFLFRCETFHICARRCFLDLLACFFLPVVRSLSSPFNLFVNIPIVYFISSRRELRVVCRRDQWVFCSGTLVWSYC